MSIRIGSSLLRSRLVATRAGPSVLARRFAPSSLAARQQAPRRLASTTPPSSQQPPTPPPPSKPSGVRISHLFGGLVSLGLLITIYGLLEWYFSLQIWPEQVRVPLKKALKARGQGDIERADGYFKEAVTVARALPSSSFDPDPLQKLSGIYVTWATMLEGNAMPVHAFVVLRDAFGLFGPDPLAANPAPVPVDAWAAGHVLDEQDKLRAVGLAQKIGQIAGRMGAFPTPPPFPHGINDKIKTWDGAAEAYLNGALVAMLRMGLQGQKPRDSPVVAGRDLDLPAGDKGDESGRVNRRGLGMTMEALADVYARQGRFDLAGQLLIQAISTVVPPQEDLPPVADRCQAAMLMTAVSSHALEPHTPAAVKASRSWSLEALQFADSAAQDAGWSAGTPVDAAAATCARARSVAYYNLGMLDEIDKKLPEAEQRFEKALAIARESGFPEGKREATLALRRVRAALGK